MPGPVPKRSEERIRRNKPEMEITAVIQPGVVEMPDLEIQEPHPMIVDFWDSLGESGQAQYYEPSDWQFARYTMHFANQLLKQGRPSAQMLQVVNAAFADLLVSEGARRRVRMEVERQQAKAEVIDLEARFREKFEEGATSL